MFNLFKKKNTELQAIDNQKEASKFILEDMEKMEGPNFTKDHFIELAFYGDWDKMNALKEILIKDGYKQILDQTDEMLVMGKWLKINFDIISILIDEMNSIAKEYDVKFDGWSCSPVE